jgi:hypothetical protein
LSDVAELVSELRERIHTVSEPASRIQVAHIRRPVAGCLKQSVRRQQTDRRCHNGDNRGAALFRPSEKVSIDRSHADRWSVRWRSVVLHDIHSCASSGNAVDRTMHLFHDPADLGFVERCRVHLSQLSLDRGIAVKTVWLPVELVQRGFDSIAEKLVPLVVFIHGDCSSLRR